MAMEAYKDVLLEYEKFWNRENTKRPILGFAYVKKDAKAYKKPESLAQQWLDEEFITERHKNYLNNVGFTAEGYPNLFTNLGPGCLAACIGGNFELAENTVWFDKNPIIDDWTKLPKIEFNENSEMWQHLVRLQNRFAKEPDFSFSITDLGGNLDIVAALRSTNELLYDLYDYPDEIAELSKKVNEIWFKAFDMQAKAVENAKLPYNCWMNIPSSKPWYPLQCDFCYMISPEHFEKLVLPGLIEQANFLPRSIYHLDGVGEIPHLDMLLDIENLNGIQWVSGDGQAPLWDEKWYPMYKKIQDKKKNLVLMSSIAEYDPKGAERLVKSLDPKGVYLSGDFSSKEKAEEMVEKINKWCE